MRHEILLARRRSRISTEVREAIERQFRLRIGDVRVFYDVRDARVEILAIVATSQARIWLEREGEKP
jgi:mRNA-degrading endonuclease RelE of RelBE toxin-antitoxin system